MKNTILFLLFIMAAAPLYAQMYTGTDTLYGNEWIDFSKTYYRIDVPADGIYRITAQTLSAAGIALQTLPGSDVRLYHLGRQYPVFVSTDQVFGSNDFLEFYGQKNRSEVDRFLFDQPDAGMLNPAYNMFNDTAAFYLCWDHTGTPLRITALNNDLNNHPPALPYCWFTLEKVYSAAYLKRLISLDLNWSWYDGEGFHKGMAATTSITMNASKIYPNGPAATATLRYGCNLGAHQQFVHVKNGALDSIFFTDQFYDFKVVQHSMQLPNNLLGAQTKIFLQSSDLIDQHGVSTATLRYPRLFDAENAANFAFELDASFNPQYVELTNFNVSSGATPLLYDLSNNFRLIPFVDNNVLKVQLPASVQTRRMLIVNAQTQINAVTSLRPVVFHDFKNDNAEFIILTNPALRKDPANGGSDPVADYAAYRSSLQGGDYKVATLNINDLYEQFAYGVRFHPIALRNFTHWVYKHWAHPRFLFIIGKGLDYDLMRDPALASQLVDSIFYVPTYGNPGADNVFMTGNRAEAPIFPVGRLAVTRPSEIRDYLDKIKEQEAGLALPQTLEDRAWMKNVLHLSGGTGGLAVSIKEAMDAMRIELEQNRFGASVSTYYKTSADPVQESAYQQILHQVNAGTSLITIFGHSSSQVVDFDIGTPDVYNNKGKYPVISTLGCFTGICSVPAKGLGEQFVLARDRGAVGFFASSNYSHLESLKDYGLEFYHLLGGADYGKTLGEQLMHTAANLQNNSDYGMKALIHQMLLQGDPALHLFAAPGPDFVIDNQSVKFTPNPIGIDNGNYALDFDVVNIGENIGGKMAVSLKQRLPNDTLRLVKKDTIVAPAFRYHIHKELPAPGREAVGFNRFLIEADADHAIPELPAGAEENNELEGADKQKGVEVYFYADDITPLFPPPFGIVSGQNIRLSASTTFSKAGKQRYLFDIDTTALFNSPLKVSGSTLQAGGLLRWKIPIPLKDSTVYYWRVTRDSLVGGHLLWKNNSFLYLSGSTGGWNQSHFYQFAADALNNLKSDSLAHRIKFQDNAAALRVAVAYFVPGKYLGIDNAVYEGFTGYGGFVQKNVQKGGVVLALVDPVTGRFVPNPPGTATNPSTTQSIHFHYFDTNHPAGRQLLISFLQHQIPDGYYVGLLTLKSPLSDTLGFSPEQWAADSIPYGVNIFRLLEQQGARRVRALASAGSKPYGLIFRQNHPEFNATDTIVNSLDSLVELRRNFFAKWTNGELTTLKIGPAKSWSSLHWRRGAYDNPAERVRISIIGLHPGAPDSLLYSSEQVFDTALNWISAAYFPYIALKITALDSVSRTMPALPYLRVLYTPVPEGALNPEAGFSFYRDTLQQGDHLKAALVFENILQQPMDSVQVKFRVENESGTGTDIFQKHKPLASGDTLWARLDFGTRLLTGKQRLVVDVNPGGAQLEWYHGNNVYFRDFYVAKDQRNPLLDVTFDGYHILNGDIVSPKPDIMATLRDDNHFLALTDTATLSLSVQYPDGSLHKIPWNDPQVQFFPANTANLDKKNVARLEYRPVFTVDGKYQLMVNGRDASGNPSGNLDYSIRFKVITKSSLSNLLNYPNPFSTSTCFVYTMTGAETPTDFRLQILTVSGRVVREVTEAEFGPLHAGAHESDFCWDGRDQFGDRLANGVYLYRVLAKKADGSNFDFLEKSNIDGFFSSGFGKMVLIR